MKKEKKELMKRKIVLSAMLDAELDKHDTSQWDGVKVQQVINEITRLNNVGQPKETLREETNPLLDAIEAKYDKLHGVDDSRLLQKCCPHCKQPLRGNTYNGKPFCFKCNKIVKPVVSLIKKPVLPNLL